jgi:hypothetical protein
LACPQCEAFAPYHAGDGSFTVLLNVVLKYQTHHAALGLTSLRLCRAINVPQSLFEIGGEQGRGCGGVECLVLKYRTQPIGMLGIALLKLLIGKRSATQSMTKAGKVCKSDCPATVCGL